MSFDPDRAVMLRWSGGSGGGGRGSGYHVGGDLVLTADHCANGHDYEAITNGRAFTATVVWRSGLREVDVALLRVDGMPAATPVPFARVDTSTGGRLERCCALGYPSWYRNSDRSVRREHAEGVVFAADGRDPYAGPDAIHTLSLRLADTQPSSPPIRAESLERPGNPWSGMSGAAVLAPLGDDHAVIGVVSAHFTQDGPNALRFVPVDAVDQLSARASDAFWSAVNARRPLPLLPRAADVSANSSTVVGGDVPAEPHHFVATSALSMVSAVVAETPSTVVTGMRGVGKSQAAAAIARSRLGEPHGLIGWVNAATRDTATADLARLADRAGVADRGGDTVESARRLLEHLATWPHDSLIVFDDAADPCDVADFLRPLGRARTLVTTTNEDFGEFGTVVEIRPFGRAESIAYLTGAAGCDADEADAVAEALGDLPLALATAAAVIRIKYRTARRYLERLERHPLSTVLPASGARATAESVASTLMLAIDDAEGSDGSGRVRSLVETMSVCSSKGVRLRVLGAAMSSESEVGDVGDIDLVLDDAIAVCRTRSLVSWTIADDALTLHPLLARLIRERSAALGRREAVAKRTVTAIEDCLHDERTAWRNRDEGSHLVHQIEALWATGLGGMNQVVVGRAIALRRWGVTQLRAAHDVRRAIELGQRAVVEADAALGPAHRETIALRTALAIALRAARRLPEAISTFHAALDSYGDTDRESAEYLSVQNNLALTLVQVERPREAIEVFAEVLNGRRTLLGEDHGDTVTTKNGLAQALYGLDRRGEAIVLMEEVLRAREAMSPSDSSKVATSLNNLATAYHADGRSDEAVALLERALDGADLGDHPELLECRMNLGVVHASCGRADVSVAILGQAANDADTMLGHDHSTTLDLRNALAAALSMSGSFDEAIEILAENLSTSIRLVGRDHGDSRDVEGLLGRITQERDAQRAGGRA